MSYLTRVWLLLFVLIVSPAVAQEEDDVDEDASSEEVQEAPEAPAKDKIAPPPATPPAAKAPRNGKKEADATGQTIEDVVVRGNAKVESDAILTILKTQKGQKLDKDNIRADINALYNLGFFSDIRFYQTPVAGGVRITVEVKEKPAIMEIAFEGLKELSESDFKDKLETKQFTILNESSITRDLRLIEKTYLEKGYNLAKASYRVDKQDGKDHEVKLTFVVDEGGKVRVGSLDIVGNTYFTDAKIIDKFISKPVTRTSAFSTPGSVYHEDFVKRDLEVMSYLYKDEGFAEVKVARPSVIMDTSREFVRVTFEVEEGIQYNVGGIEYSGDLLFTEAEFNEKMRLKPGELFRFSNFRKDVETIVDMYGDKGYAFVDVNPVHRFDREKKLVFLDYQITKGEKVYFGEMTIVGNTKTRDNVIRRELDVADGELYSHTRLASSKRNIERLGFFEEVQSIRRRDEKDPSLLHYKFKVKEKPTGQLQASVGFSPGNTSNESSWFGQGRYSEENQSGRGWKTGVSARWNGGKTYDLDIDFNNPRVDDSRWSLGFNTFLRNEVREPAEGIEVTERRVGGSVTVGRRIIELIHGSITYRWAKISQSSNSFVLERFKDEGIASTLIFGLSRDSTNNYLDPSEGMRSRISQAVTGGPLLGGTRQFLETTVAQTFFFPVDFTDTYRTYFRLHGEFGLLTPYGDRQIPFYERYRLGGYNDLRGYGFDDIGPRFYVWQAPGDVLRDVNKGGNKQLYFQAEYFFPIIPEANIKGLFFTDIGRVYDDNEPITLKGFKRDFGFGFRWITPIAPFRFEWAYPYENGEVGDMEFVFSIGY